MARKNKMTGFAKLLIVIIIVGTITYFVLQEYGNPFKESVESVESVENAKNQEENTKPNQ